MYGISKGIRTEFSVLTSPSFGTIKPALMRLEKKGLIKSQKTLSEGGRPSVYYSITKEGEKAFDFTGEGCKIRIAVGCVDGLLIGDD